MVEVIEPTIDVSQEELEENYRRVVKGLPLTRPLWELRKACNFVEGYVTRRLKANRCRYCNKPITIGSKTCSCKSCCSQNGLTRKEK